MRGRCPTAAPPDATSDRADRGPLPACTKPIIGAINGAAITGGFEIALNCDFLVASDRARFADTHARVGIQPGWGLTVLLPQAVGLRRAREMSATGNFIDAETALAWGLVNHVVPHDELLATVRGLAADIVSNDQAAVRQIYATYDEGSEVTAARRGRSSNVWPVSGRAAASIRPRSSGAERRSWNAAARRSDADGRRADRARSSSCRVGRSTARLRLARFARQRVRRGRRRRPSWPPSASGTWPTP